jgi:membrane protease YdiL (CAAX protease family)
MLRARALLWGAIGVLAVSLPWSGNYCTPGSFAGITVVAIAVALCAGPTVGTLRSQLGWTRRDSAAGLSVAWLLLAVIAAGEEVFFRGLMLEWLAASSGMASAVLLTAAAFGVAHMRRGRMRAGAFHTLTGVVFGVVAWLTAGWIAGATIHILYNCVVYGWGPVPVPATRTTGAVVTIESR